MAMEEIKDYTKYEGTYISRTNLLSNTGKHRFLCAMCYNTSICKKKHSISNSKWDTSLYSKVKFLVENMPKCSGIYISSGYRTPGNGGHDKCVGGGGNGPHTIGRAVDICFVKKDGSYLNCRQIAVVCEKEKLFNGIAPISEPPRNAYIHLDTKDRKWLGDEHYLGFTGCINNGANSDFLKYYRNKGLRGFDSYDAVKASLNWEGKTYVGLPEQEIGPSNSGEGKITVVLKPSTSTGTLRYERPYFKKYTGSSTNLEEALKELGEASVGWYIVSIAKHNGINGYSGTTAEDNKLMLKLREGTLIRP